MEEALCFSWEELIVCSLRDFSIVARMIFCFESFVLLLAVVEFSWSFPPKKVIASEVKNQKKLSRMIPFKFHRAAFGR